MIKLILLAGVLVAGFLLLRGTPSAGHLAFRRLVALMGMAAGVVSILFPALVTSVANLVGVGRGTDLILYVLVLAFLFVTMGMYQRMSALEERCVILARQVALREAQRDQASLPRERIG